MQTKIILDTDIGDDIDDAFALALAYSANESIDLIGVTTVYRNTEARAKQVAKFFDTHQEKNIPFYIGESNPINEPIHYFEKDIVDENGVLWPCQYDHSYGHYPVESGAVDFIIKEAKRLKSKLTLVAVGPLTNIAKAILKAPKIMNNIHRIVIMGGWFEEQKPEWNILCDPEAADIVFKSGIPVYAVGLDVTLQCRLEDDTLKQLYDNKDKQSQLLTVWIKRWFNHFSFDKSVLHDPLAIATIIDPNICTFEKKGIEVDLMNQRGTTIINPESKHKIYVATTVDTKLFFEIFKTNLALESVKTE